MKSLILIFTLISISVQAQTDTSTFRAYDKTFNVYGQTHRNVSFSKSMFENLVISGDSIYNTLNIYQFENKLKNGDYKLMIINNRDSINKIISDRVTSIFILVPNAPAKKTKH